MSRYAQEFDRSLSDPEGFWGDAAKMIDWYQPPTQVLDRSTRRSTGGSPAGC